MKRRTAEDLQKSIEYLVQAAARDSNFTLALTVSTKLDNLRQDLLKRIGLEK